MRRNAASIRPRIRVLFASFLFLFLFSSAILADTNSFERRETAKTQFDRAEKERQELESRPESARSLKDYTSLVSSYRRVSLITAHAPQVPEALDQIAELYRAMGDLFDVKFYQMAIDSYHFLLGEYPTSHYRESAMLVIGEIEQNDLHDPVSAQKSYQAFLALHPRSARGAEVRGILDKLAQGEPAKSTSQQPQTRDEANRITSKALVADSSASAIAASADTKQTNTGERSIGVERTGNSDIPQLTRIRTWNADTYTRIVIDVGAQVKYQAARITNPDRIYFDIENTKINSALLHKSMEVADGGLLKGVRIAQNQSDVVRVVLEVDHVKDYSVFLLPDPYRLIVDIYGNHGAAEETARAGTPPSGSSNQPIDVVAGKPAPKNPASLAAKTGDRASSKSMAALIERPMFPSRLPGVEPSQKPPVMPATTDALPSLPAMPLREPRAPGRQQSAAKTVPSGSGRTAKNVANGVFDADDNAPTYKSEKSGKSRNSVSTDDSIDGDTPPLVARQASAKKAGIIGKSAHEQAEEMGPPPMPELTRDGQHSLTRALGLKIGRIVIDAGHGGHDTGTIGPTGLMEKDVCLDVALRIGKLIQLRLPGAEVVYTREDDTFIPLEKRTEIANESRADLFLSVHGNSSQDHKARGIETYYLNFTGSSDAMEVASRENALSENSVADLQDIVQKITRNEKIGESRDFAGIIQDSLSKRMETLNRGDRNRGVRKAPFVVLIGANMPSVLSEISFLSNPSDEQWLKKPENRQRIAEGLYHGIETYLQSTNSLTYDQVHLAPGTRAGMVARSGNSQ